MDLFEKNINTKEFYNLATESYYNIDSGEYQNNEVILIDKSISFLIDHSFIPTPCFEIKIEIKNKTEEKIIGYYILYINEKKEFIDEFLVFN